MRADRGGSGRLRGPLGGLHQGRDAENLAGVSGQEPGLDFVKSNAGFNFPGKFHKLIQKSASHYTLDGENTAIKAIESRI